MEPSSKDAFVKAKRQALKKMKSTCTLQTFLSWFPIINWLRNYKLEFLSGDIIAGVTCALTVIPQGIGYAPLAGLPLEYGLYASIVPGFLYAIFGSVQQASIGPTAVNALMAFEYASVDGVQMVHRCLTLSFFVGLIEISLGVLNLGCLLNYISKPVISAFSSAVAIQVSTSQVKGLLGLGKVKEGRGFVNTWKTVFTHFVEIEPCDAALGFTCIGILLFLRKLKELRWLEGTDPEAKRARILQKSKWALSVSRNSMVVVVAAFIAYVISDLYGNKTALTLTGFVQGGLPDWQLPWQFNVPQKQIQTLESPLEMAQDFGIGLLMLPLVSVMQHLAIAKFYTPPTSKMDASKEIVALGMCQFVGSFIGTLPITCSFGRSAINSSSGVNTPVLSGCITGLIILATCAFLTPYFAYIPTAALSAVIICAMIFTIDVEILLPIWKSKKVDLVPYTLTFLVSLFVSTDMGLIVGTVTHLCILIYSSGSPKVNITKSQVDDIQYLLVQPDRALYFPSVETLRTKLLTGTTTTTQNDPQDVEATNAVAKNDDLELPVIVDFSGVAEMDFTAARGIRAFTKVMKKSGRSIYLCAVNERLEGVLQGADPSLLVVYSNVNEAELKLKTSF